MKLFVITSLYIEELCFCDYKEIDAKAIREAFGLRWFERNWDRWFLSKKRCIRKCLKRNNLNFEGLV